MRRLIRASLVTAAVVAVAVVALRVSGVWQRFRDRQFPEGEAKPTGRLAQFYGWAAPRTNEWLYGIFARRLDLQPDDDVLDVACGSGAFLRKHASHVQRIAGLDHSEDLIGIALRENRERVEEGTAEFVVGDATSLPWEDDRFSVVTSNCIDCFSSKAKQTLAEMYRVLRPGGRVLVADDHEETMESLGFTGVTVERVLWGSLTSGIKPE